MISALPRLHAVTDDRVVLYGDIVPKAAAMAAALGETLAVHLRTRELPGQAMLALARALDDVLGPHGSWLIVNDRADIARAVPARAIVTGRSGLTAADVRRAAPGAIVGRSVHDAAEIRTVLEEAPDFLVAGSVFATPSHPDRTPAGLEVVSAAAAGGLPVIAIGGLTAGRTTEVIAAGAWGVAAIRALWDAPDPAAAAGAFLSALPRDESVSVVVNGEARRARRGLTLEGLLADLALDPRSVVVEHNRRIVRKDALGVTSLGEGDTIELVHFVGGG